MEETRQQLDDAGRHEILVCDFSRLEMVAPVIKQAIVNGKLDGLIYAAGMCPASPIVSQDVVEAQTAMAVNYFGFLETMKYFSKRLYCEGGSAVAISSVSAEVGWRAGAVYSGTKGAVSASVRSLALELVVKHIRVNAVMPSNIKTPMYESCVDGVLDANGLAELIKKQPLGLGEPEDVANAVCFLLSDAAKFITGTNLVVDGGYLAQ